MTGIQCRNQEISNRGPSHPSCDQGQTVAGMRRGVHISHPGHPLVDEQIVLLSDFTGTAHPIVRLATRFRAQSESPAYHTRGNCKRASKTLKYLMIIVIAIMVHIAIVLAVLGAIPLSVLRVSPTMVPVISVAIAIPISDGDVTKIDSYCGARCRRKRRCQREERKCG